MQEHNGWLASNGTPSPIILHTKEQVGWGGGGGGGGGGGKVGG